MNKPLLLALLALACLSGITARASLRESQARIEARYGQSIQSEKGASATDTYEHYRRGDLDIVVRFTSGVSWKEDYSKSHGEKLTDAEITDLLDANRLGGAWVSDHDPALARGEREWSLRREDDQLAKAWLTSSGSLIVYYHSRPARHVVQHPPVLDGLLKSDQIILVDPHDLKLESQTPDGQQVPMISSVLGTPETPATASQGVAIKGDPVFPLHFLYLGFQFPRTRHCLVFLDSRNGQQMPRGVIFGFNQDPPDFTHKFDTARDAYELIKQMFFAEPSPADSLWGAMILVDGPESVLQGSSQQLLDYSKSDQANHDPVRSLAAFALLLHADGIAALRELPPPDFEKTISQRANKLSLEAWQQANVLQGLIGDWIRNHASEENYVALAAFAESQSGRLRAETLIALRPYATRLNYHAIAGIFRTDSDPSVRYAAITNLCVAFGESVPGTDIVARHSKAMFKYWSQKIDAASAPPHHPGDSAPKS